MSISVILIDDEPLAQDELAYLLERYDDFCIVARCEDVFSALRKIREHKPDAVFLDIIMPGQDGFTLLDYMAPEEHHPHVVVVTGGESDFAVRAYAEGVLDYLPKPIEEERFDKAIERIRSQVLDPNVEVLPYPDRILEIIPCIFNQRIKFIKPKDIEFVRSDSRGIYIICAEKDFYTELTLATFETKTTLIRCHRQHMINLVHIDELIPLENGLAEIKTISGHRVPVSRHYLKRLKDKLGI
ncbi:MAG: response regulator [Gammaproteobacteria bacterium]|nr:response regulator [Gammaproteobacteria bacterium]